MTTNKRHPQCPRCGRKAKDLKKHLKGHETTDRRRAAYYKPVRHGGAAGGGKSFQIPGTSLTFTVKAEP